MGSSAGVGGSRRQRIRATDRWCWSRLWRRALQAFLVALIIGTARTLGEGLASEISHTLIAGIERALLALRDLELKDQLTMAVWAAELVMGVATIGRLRHYEDRRFARMLIAYCSVTCVYYLLLCVLGRQVILQHDFRHVLLTGMSFCLFDLAAQAKRLHALAYASLYGLLFGVLVSMACHSTFWQINCTTWLAVLAASLAGWAWRDRLSPVALFFWCVFVATLAFRSATMLSSDDDCNLLYFSLLNARWVALSERCGRRATALPAAATRSWRRAW